MPGGIVIGADRGARDNVRSRRSRAAYLDIDLALIEGDEDAIDREGRIEATKDETVTRARVERRNSSERAFGEIIGEGLEGVSEVIEGRATELEDRKAIQDVCLTRTA